MEEKFKERIGQYKVLWEDENKIYSRIANLRLIMLLASLYMTYLLLSLIHI